MIYEHIHIMLPCIHKGITIIVKVIYENALQFIFIFITYFVCYHYSLYINCKAFL